MTRRENCTVPMSRQCIRQYINKQNVIFKKINDYLKVENNSVLISLPVITLNRVDFYNKWRMFHIMLNLYVIGS